MILKFISKIKVVIVIILAGYTSYSQNNTIVNKLVNQLQNVHQEHSLDLVYIQTNKGIYETQEDLWFKGYVLDAQFFFPSTNSKTLFVQLIYDKTNEVVWEDKYEIDNGFVDGHILLSDSLETGTYSLVAFSSNSLNRNIDEFHPMRKVLVLKNIKTKNQDTEIQKDDSFHFNTFPEGGSLVSGIESVVGFKGINSKGLPVKFSGALYENNKALLNFKSEHAGMGSFSFTPNGNKKYHIQILEPKQDKVYPLDQISPSGKTLRLISNSNKELILRVSQNANSKKEKIYVRLQVRGNVYSIAEATLEKNTTIKIPLAEIPKGIAEVTLFDKDLKPIAERLVYINQDEKLYITATLDKDSYAKREKARLKIKVTDKNGKPIVAHLGLSIYDKIYENRYDSKTIESHFYLATQLKGKLYNPSYYFDSTNINRKKALDLLLLSQGWRRYVWTETNLTSKKGIPAKQIIKEKIIGKVVLERSSRQQKENPKEHVVLLFTANPKKEKEYIITDSIGQFTFDPNHLKMANNAYVYLKPMTISKPKYVLNIKDLRFGRINDWRKTKTTNYPIFIKSKTTSENPQAYILASDVNKIDEVFIKTKTKNVFRDKYLGKLDSIAKFNFDYVCVANILNCKNHTSESALSRKPIDGEMIKVRYDPSQFNSYGREKFNTFFYKYREYTEEELLKKFNLSMIKGYYGKKDFYEPTYDSITVKDPFQDMRNTLLWKPRIITNSKGEASLEFFSSDIDALFIGNIEGVSGNGLLGTNKFKFLVRRYID